MKLSIFFVVCIHFFTMRGIVSDDSVVNRYVEDYIKKRSRSVQETFSQTKNLMNKKEEHVIEIEELIKVTLPSKEKSKNYFTTTFLDTQFFIHKDKFLYYNDMNNTVITSNIFTINSTEDITYTRAIQYEQLGMLLTATESEMSIYSFNHTKKQFMQKISAPNAVDAQFFINNGKLYLIIARSKGDNIAQTSIYQWLGTNFDETETISTTGAFSILTFGSSTSEIIVIFQYLSNRQILSTVCEFKFEKIKKIHNLRIIEPVHAEKYVFKNKTYVIMFENSGTNQIYSWNEKALQLTEITEFKTPQAIRNSVAFQFNGSTVILLPLLDRIEVYIANRKGLRLEKEEQYSSTYSSILDILTLPKNDTIEIYVLGTTEDNDLSILAMTFNLFTELNDESVDRNMLRSCMNNLEVKIYNQGKILREFESENLRVFENSSSKSMETKLGQTEFQDIAMEDSLKDIRSKLQKLQPFVNGYPNEEDDMIINGNVIAKGLLVAKKLSGKDINVKNVNGFNWTPEQWLMYQAPQTVTGRVKMRRIDATNLTTSSEDTLFKDLLRKNGNQEILHEISVKNLIVDKVFASQINNVLLEDIYLASNPKSISGVKTIENLKTDETTIHLLNEKSPDILLSFTNPSTKTTFDPNLEIENLIAESIDNVHWHTFVDNVFKIGETPAINGNLIFVDKIKTKNLTLKTLNGLPVSNLFTTSTDQTIKSDIEFNRIFAENISSNTTNNIQLADAVIFGDGKPIEGPVKFDKIHIRGNLELVGKLDKSFFLNNGGHIIGTNESDLLQRYNGKIKIKGNLHVTNLIMQKQSQLFLAEEETDPNIPNIYWRKSIKQEIPVRIQALKGISVPHLLTERINNVKTSQYMLNTNEDKLETSFYFTNASIAGSVILNNSARHKPDLNKINKNAVKSNGSFVITGRKTYADTLKVKHLATYVLEGIRTYDALTTNWSGAVAGKKKFKNVIVKGNLSSEFQSLKVVNDADLKKLTENIIRIDKPQNLGRLHFRNITVSNLYTPRLNEHYMKDYMLNLEKLYTIDKINNLKVNGSVMLKSVQNVSTINNIAVDDLLNNTLQVSPLGAVMLDLEFLDHLKVNNLVTAYINDVNLRKLTKRLLRKRTDQTISAPYSFTKIKAKNIVTPKINNISVEHIIDVSSEEPQTIYASYGIQFTSAKVLQSLRGDETSPCDIKTFLSNLKNPPTQNWYTMAVRGNVTFLDTDNVLSRIFEKAIVNNSNNVVHAPVTFSSNILTTNVFSRKYINDVNIKEIIDDAVMDTEEKQVITGHKTFPTMRISNAEVKRNTDCPMVNDKNIPEINKNIIRKNNIPPVIRGKKTFFNDLQTKRFYSSKIGNTDPGKIVSLQSPRKIPSATFESLEVLNNLNVTHINHMPFQDVLQKRLLIDNVDEQITNGVYFFDNVKIENMETPSLNNISMDDVVFDVGRQEIFSVKRFLKPVEVYGNLKSDYINGVNLTNIHEKSALTGETLTMSGSIAISRPSVLKGNIEVETINGYPIANIKEILYKGVTKSEANKIHHMKEGVTRIVNKYLRGSQAMPSEYMYLEKSDVLQISVSNAISARAVTIKGYALIHVTGVESGEYCGLPSSCKCPVQYSIEVSPEHSIAVYPNKGFQRIFTYDDENMIIHFITNSVSSESTCRTDTARVLNEISMMSWNRLPTENSTGRFYQYDKVIEGYISGAEFFTLNGRSYAVIGRYYDANIDSYDLKCLVIRFSDDKSKAEEIQRIPSKGAWSIYLFHTAQGVTLVIGNTGSTLSHFDEKTNTTIYRFNEEEQQFKELRTIPSYGSLMATGVVLGADSLIVLAHKNAPLQILKYNHHFENYYLYQSFELDSHIEGISVFYTGGFGISDAYLCIVTGNERYSIYSFRFIEGWKFESSGELEGLRNLIPFQLNSRPYLFAPSTKMSSLLTVVKQGSG